MEKRFNGIRAGTLIAFDVSDPSYNNDIREECYALLLEDVDRVDWWHARLKIFEGGKVYTTSLSMIPQDVRIVEDET